MSVTCRDCTANHAVYACLLMLTGGVSLKAACGKMAKKEEAAPAELLAGSAALHGVTLPTSLRGGGDVRKLVLAIVCGHPLGVLGLEGQQVGAAVEGAVAVVCRRLGVVVRVQVLGGRNQSAGNQR